jgi:isorenieratene synthase
MSKLNRRSFLRKLGFGTALSSAAPILSSCKTTSTMAPLSSDSFNPYVINPLNPEASDKLSGDTPKKVLVVGGGVAGLSAATILSERGYSVTIREAAPFVGGKLHTRSESLNSGEFKVDNGVHLWHKQYHNFSSIFEKIGVSDDSFTTASQSYVFRDFKNETQPTLTTYPDTLVSIVSDSNNLSSLSSQETYLPLHDVFFYNHSTNFRKFDNLSYLEWLVSLEVNEDFKQIVLAPFANSTFNDPTKISAAESILNLHTQLTSLPEANLTKTTNSNHEETILTPWIKYLEANGVRIKTESPVPGLSFYRGKCLGAKDYSKEYQYTVLTSDVPGAKSLIHESKVSGTSTKKKVKKIQARFSGLKTAPTYRVLRIWLDKKVSSGLSPEQSIINCPQHLPVSKLFIVDLLDKDYKAWSETNNGSVIELHILNSKDLDGFSPEQIWEKLKGDIKDILSKTSTEADLEQLNALDYSMGSYSNFTSFEVGQGAIKPTHNLAITEGISNLLFAGDWVQFNEFPVSLMERAVTTGIAAANDILFMDGVKQEALIGVRPKGSGALPHF